jgi:hypothetical protein
MPTFLAAWEFGELGSGGRLTKAPDERAISEKERGGDAFASSLSAAVPLLDREIHGPGRL